ncbi:zinc transporter Zip99C isoform X2 [Arctopsyche grandis]|uniref:zinc transporter Zip99C isoform X2 n=1 Tax=Arctopsyche grandis TaxID=121162 RepID=UPI00406D8A8B
MANVSEDVISHIYNEVLKVVPDYVLTITDDFVYHPWLFAFLGSMLVGLSGIFPLFIIPVNDTTSLENNAESPSLKILLSFAVGALLADVFLHLLPEAWLYAQDTDHASMKCGLWVLCGLLLFIIIEKIFSEYSDSEELEEEEPKTSDCIPQVDIEEIHRMIEKEKKKRDEALGPNQNGGAILADADNGPLNSVLQESCLFNNNSTSPGGTCGLVDGMSNVCGGSISRNGMRGRCLKGRWIERLKEKSLKKQNKDGSDKENSKSKHVAGYLNLLANSIDNFTHGLAVGGSFLVSFRVGVLSTFAILVHEIPHEVGDFAILLRSGFSRWEAAKAQLATATGGLIGALAAVMFSGASNTLEAKTSWILPFTAGGFLHIALITVLPDLLKEENPIESMKQLFALLFGIFIMGSLTYYLD